MADEDLLTKDERDALMAGIQEGSRRAGGGEEAQPYELLNPENVIMPLQPILDTVTERFVHHLQVGLGETFRRNLAVRAAEQEVRRYGSLAGGLRAPVSVSVIALPPLSGPGLLIMDRALVFALVDSFFGGTGNSRPPPGSKFTAIEARLIKRLRQQVFDHLSYAWKPFLAVNGQALSHESNPQFVTALEKDAPLVLLCFDIFMPGATPGDGQEGGDGETPDDAREQTEEAAPAEDATDDNDAEGQDDSGAQDGQGPDDGAVRGPGHLGRIQLALPCAMFEPVRGALLMAGAGQRPDPSDKASLLLGEGVKDSRITVRGLLAETELSLSELLALKVGDFRGEGLPAGGQGGGEHVP